MMGVGQYMDIKELRSEGLTIRAIAQRTGLSRNTVRKVLRGEHNMKAQSGLRPGKLDAYKDYVRERYECYQLSAVRWITEIRAMGYDGSLPTLRRYLHTLKAPSEHLTKTTLRYETAPGNQAQADWTQCGRFTDAEGNVFTVYAFVMVLSFSRRVFVHFTTRLRMAELLRAHGLAFAYFGGWPTQILYDNMKQVRVGPGQLNEQLRDFADHYGFVIKTHRPYRPRTQGKVERTVDYVKDNFLAGRTFASLDDLNAPAHHWLEHTANVRVHGTTGKVPKQRWPMESLTALTSRLPYELVQPVPRTVSHEAMVHYQGSRYCVPPAYAGQPVVVQSVGGQIQVRSDDLIIAEHRAALKAGQCIVDKDPLAQQWKLTEQQVAVPTTPGGERWHLLCDPCVEAMPLTRFEEVTA